MTRSCVCSVLGCFSGVQLFSSLWTVARQAPPPMGFPRHEYWSELPCPPPGDHPSPVIKPVSLLPSALPSRFFTTSTASCVKTYILRKIFMCLISLESHGHCLSTEGSSTASEYRLLASESQPPSPCHSFGSYSRLPSCTLSKNGWNNSRLLWNRTAVPTSFGSFFVETVKNGMRDADRENNWARCQGEKGWDGCSMIEGKGDPSAFLLVLCFLNMLVFSAFLFS